MENSDSHYARVYQRPHAAPEGRSHDLMGRKTRAVERLC